MVGLHDNMKRLTLLLNCGLMALFGLASAVAQMKLQNWAEHPDPK
jgi:hypothetical protein